MPASYVGNNGKGNVNNGTALTFTTTRTIAAGEHVCVFERSVGGGALPTAISVGALSLTSDVNSGVQTAVSLWSAPATAQINSGSTVTVTYSVNPTNQQAICFSLGGIVTTSYVDKTKTNSWAGGAHTTGATAVTTQADEIAVGGQGWGTSGDTATPDGGYTEIDEINEPVNGFSSTCSYLVLTATGAQTASWTMSPGTSYGDAVIATYKGLSNIATVAWFKA